jgi:hypothetical protein
MGREKRGTIIVSGVQLGKGRVVVPAVWERTEELNHPPDQRLFTADMIK